MKFRYLAVFSLAGFICAAAAQDDYEEYVSQGCLLTLGDLSEPLIPGQLPDREVDITTFEATWANPQNVESDVFNDHYTDEPVKSIKYHFQNFDVWLEKPVSRASDIWYLTRLDLRDVGVPLSCDLHVGDSIEAFLSALGEPLLSSTSELVDYEWRKLEQLSNGDYSAGRAAILLTVAEGGSVTQISWRWYSD